MSVNVPIGRGIAKTSTELKFPNIKFSQPDSPKETQREATSEAEFLQLLADNGKITNNQLQLVGAADLDVIIPNGSTFYLLEAHGGYTASGGTLRFRTVIDGTVTTEKAGGATSPASVDVTIKGFSLVGNGIDLVRLSNTAGTVNANIQGYLLPTPSSRGGLKTI